MKKAGAIVVAREARPGDLVIFTPNAENKEDDANHTGIVREIRGNTLITVETFKDGVGANHNKGKKYNDKYHYVRIAA